MPIGAKIVLDSVSEGNMRLTTMEMTFPRSILAEVNTHRAFSRNSASSRAIPTHKLIERVLQEPYVPDWTQLQKGMQGDAITDQATIDDINEAWRGGAQNAIRLTRMLSSLGVHKQDANRPIEPWLYHTALVSSTTWSNFLWQRTHKAAHPAMQALATAVADALVESKPQLLCDNEWHLPYIQQVDWQWAKKQAGCMVCKNKQYGLLKKVSAARCARVSYLTHDGVRDQQKDLELFDKLVHEDNTNDPMHASPLEHVAMPTVDILERSGNFRGWKQFREEFFMENVYAFEWKGQIIS